MTGRDANLEVMGRLYQHLNQRFGIAPFFTAICFLVAFPSIMLRTFSEDIGLWDETLYLFAGINQTDVSLDYSPAYTRFFGVVNWLTGNPQTSYFLGRTLAATLLIASTCYLAYLITNKVLFSLLVLTFLTTTNITHPWPAVSTFAISFVFLSVIASIKFRRNLLISHVLLILAVAARIELYPLLLLLPIVLVSQIIKVPKFRKLSVINLGGILLLSFLFILKFGLPKQNGKLFDAYIAHEQLQRSLNPQNGILDPWSTFKSLVDDKYSGASTMSDIVLKNTGAFIDHLTTNLNLFPSWLKGTVLFADGAQKNLALLSSMLLVLYIIVNIYDARHSFEALKTQFSRPDLILLTSAFAIYAMVSIVIFPRSHYLLPLTSLSILIVGYVIQKNSSNFEKIANKLSSSILIFIMLCSSTVSGVNYFQKPLCKDPIIKTIETLNGIEMNYFKILDTDNGYCTYINSKCKEFDYSLVREANLADFIQTNDINTIVLNKRLMDNLKDTNKVSAFEKLVSNGWTRIEVLKDADLSVMLKK